MRKFAQFLAAFRAKHGTDDLSADLFFLEQAEHADRRAPAYRRRATDNEPVTRYDLGGNAAFHLAATNFNPCAMTDRDNRRLADLLLDAGAISAQDHEILVRGPIRRRSILTDLPAPRNYLADWQESLAKHMGYDDYSAMDTDSRALNVLGKVMVAREAAA